MPKAREALNAFTSAELGEVSGLSQPMIDYLKREGLLTPAYASVRNRRGRVRYYSFRDLLIAGLIQRLRESGVQLAPLRTATDQISDDSFWEKEEPPREAEWLVSDGRDVRLRDGRTMMRELESGRRSSFAFLVHIGRLRDEVRERLPASKRPHFSMKVDELRFAEPPSMRMGPR